MSICRLVMCTIVILSCSLAVAEDYQISLTKPWKVGDKYEIKYTGIALQKMTISTDGKVVNSNETNINAKLEGVGEVLEIDDSKRKTKIKFIISKCLRTIGNPSKEVEILQKDSEIIIEMQNKRMVFLFHDKPLPKNVTEVLSLFFSLPRSETTDDDIFGTKERKEVGDSWEVNKTMAAKDLSNEGMKIDSENIKGKTTLEKVLDIDGTKCLLISAKMEMSKLGIPLPPGMKVEKSEMKADFSGEVAADPSKPSFVFLSERKIIGMNFTAQGKPNPQGPSMKMEMVGNQNVKGSEKRLK